MLNRYACFLLKYILCFTELLFYRAKMHLKLPMLFKRMNGLAPVDAQAIMMTNHFHFNIVKCPELSISDGQPSKSKNL